MNCQCIDEITAKLTTHATEKAGAINPKVSMDSIGINLSTGEAIISLPFTLRADNRPFNTAKGKPMNMVASFCPFCGASMKREKVPA